MSHRRRVIVAACLAAVGIFPAQAPAMSDGADGQPVLASAAGAGDVLRAPTKVERRGLLRAYRKYAGPPRDGRELAGVCVHRRDRRYGVVWVSWPVAGGEGTVFRRTGRLRWRYVTGGSLWDGKPAVRALMNCLS